MLHTFLPRAVAMHERQINNHEGCSALVAFCTAVNVGLPVVRFVRTRNIRSSAQVKARKLLSSYCLRATSASFKATAPNAISLMKLPLASI